MVSKMRVSLVALENLASREETPQVGEKPRHQRGGLNDMEKLELDKCKACQRVRKHHEYVFMSDYQKALIVKYYDVSYRLVVCPECRERILNGTPI